MESNTGCEFPDCPSKMLGDQLVSELRVIQDNQKDQQRLQEKMVQNQIDMAAFSKDIAYIKQDISGISHRISTAFNLINTKADKKEDILPKETLITKSDFGKFVAYTGGLLALILTVFEFIIPLFRK